MRTQRLFSFWSRWRLDRRGVSAVEFALILPTFLILYLGGFEISNATATYRKVTDTTVELANVTAQYTTMASSDVTTVMSASAQIMAPYSTSSLKIVLSEITTDANNNATVTWSQSYNGGTPLTVGAAVTLPTGYGSKSTSYILVNTTYSYVPTIGASFVGTIPMSDQLYMLPRQSPSIPYTG
jgi:Flp pilus assembly protein TadG